MGGWAKENTYNTAELPVAPRRSSINGRSLQGLTYNTRKGGYLGKRCRSIFLTNCEIAPGGGSNPRPNANFQSFGIDISYTSRGPTW